MTYQSLTEEEVKLRFITPAIENSGWDKHSQIRMEYAFTDGEMQIRGSKSIRGKQKRADYRRFGFRQNALLAEAQPHAAAQLLCGYRPQGQHPG